MSVANEKRIILIWLSHSDTKSKSLNLLEPLYKAAKEKKYTVAVFESGTDELKESIAGLLLNQKRRDATPKTNHDKRGT